MSDSSSAAADALEKMLDDCDAKVLFLSDQYRALVEPYEGRLGKLVAGDDSSYRYLAESIRMHPGQEELKAMMHKGGFGHVDYHNLTGGIAALHVGIKC